MKVKGKFLLWVDFLEYWIYGFENLSEIALGWPYTFLTINGVFEWTEIEGKEREEGNERMSFSFICIPKGVGRETNRIELDGFMHIVYYSIVERFGRNFLPFLFILKMLFKYTLSFNFTRGLLIMESML